MKGEDFVPIKMHLSPPVTLAAVCTKVVVQLLIHCLLLLILFVGVMWPLFLLVAIILIWKRELVA